MTTTVHPICDHCIRAVFSEDITERPTCAAFPDGIPDAILYEAVDHREPYPGDDDVRFEQDPDEPAPPEGVYTPHSERERASTP